VTILVARGQKIPSQLVVPDYTYTLEVNDLFHGLEPSRQRSLLHNNNNDADSSTKVDAMSVILENSSIMDGAPLVLEDAVDYRAIFNTGHLHLSHVTIANMGGLFAVNVVGVVVLR
jgi:hypothetical protein